MLEIICAGSLALSISICQNTESIDLTRINQVETPSITQENIIQETEYLVKGKPHQSRYRREADREIHELRHRGRDDRNYRDRYYREPDRYRRGREHDDDYRGRVYREPHRHRREIEYDQERDRYYVPRRSRNRYFRRSR